MTFPSLRLYKVPSISYRFSDKDCKVLVICYFVRCFEKDSVDNRIVTRCQIYEHCSSLFSYLSSIFYVKLNICPVYDFPSLKLTCSFTSDLSVMSFILLSIKRSRSLYVRRTRERLGGNSLPLWGGLLDFISSITRLLLHILVFRSVSCNCYTFLIAIF